MWETDPSLAKESPVMVSGPTLAAQALRADVVDELHMVVVPVTVGAGKPAFPTDLRLDLELLDQRRFRNGSVHVAYRVLASTRASP